MSLSPLRFFAVKAMKSPCRESGRSATRQGAEERSSARDQGAEGDRVPKFSGEWPHPTGGACAESADRKLPQASRQRNEHPQGAIPAAGAAGQPFGGASAGGECEGWQPLVESIPIGSSVLTEVRRIVMKERWDRDWMPRPDAHFLSALPPSSYRSAAFAVSGPHSQEGEHRRTETNDRSRQLEQVDAHMSYLPSAPSLRRDPRPPVVCGWAVKPGERSVA